MHSFLVVKFRRFVKRAGIGLFSLFCIFTSPIAAAQQASISAHIESASNGILFSVKNNSNESVSILRWETPFDNELTQDVFDVIANNQRATYTGKLVKRGTPQAQDYIQISPNGTAATLIELNRFYRLTRNGIHSVRFNSAFNVMTANQTATVSIASSAVDVNLYQAPEIAYAVPSGYSSCSAAQQAQIATDLDAAEQITLAAQSALESLPVNERANSPRYKQWFGNYDATRYNRVQDMYGRAAQIMQSSVEFNCSCTEPYFAYVFPADPFKVYLCNAYWTAPLTGSDSRSGTLLHELSHFPEIGNTIDSAYGPTRAAALAISNPAAAINNADSIEYFAENTPFLEMSAGQFGPTQPTAYIPLELDAVTTGTIVANQYTYFEATGASSITLNYTSGDADLYVFSSSARDQLLCESLYGQNVESCDITTTDTVYIEVHGYRTSQYTIVAQAPARPTVTTQSGPTAVCIDTAPIGDGWGWNGTSSCQVEVINTLPTQCVDPDGDGWGWNGTSSCRAVTNETPTPTETPTDNQSTCIDKDGDGWGWNGSSSCLVSGSGDTTNSVSRTCVDNDGDGWGWDGVASCLMP